MKTCYECINLKASKDNVGAWRLNCSTWKAKDNKPYDKLSDAMRINSVKFFKKAKDCNSFEEDTDE